MTILSCYEYWITLYEKFNKLNRLKTWKLIFYFKT